MLCMATAVALLTPPVGQSAHLCLGLFVFRGHAPVTVAAVNAYGAWADDVD